MSIQLRLPNVWTQGEFVEFYACVRLLVFCQLESLPKPYSIHTYVNPFVNIQVTPPLKYPGASRAPKRFFALVSHLVRSELQFHHKAFSRSVAFVGLFA